MKSIKIKFSGHSGDQLAARLDEPVSAPHAYALFAHCFTCSKDISVVRRITGRLTSSGIGVLRFDFTGLGHSGGEFENTNFSSNVQDLVAAADWLRKNREAPKIIIGHSFGGAAAILAGAEIPEVKAIVTIGAPHDPGHVIQNFAGSLDDIARDGQAEVTLAGRKFTISQQFVEDVASTRLDATLATLDRALLLLHSPIDEMVGIENASSIFQAAKHPKSFVTLDTADHLLTKAEDAEYAADIIATWSRRYLDIKENEPRQPTQDGNVMVSEADPDGFLQDIASGTKHVLADEPKSVGGNDLGLTPYQLVSAGLGACTSMTIRMYARRKGWPLEHVAVEVGHGKNHAADCEACDEDGSKIDIFHRMIQLTGDLTEEQRIRCLQIAEKCPVHRTLEGNIRIETLEVS